MAGGARGCKGAGAKSMATKHAQTNWNGGRIEEDLLLSTTHIHELTHRLYFSEKVNTHTHKASTR